MIQPNELRIGNYFYYGSFGNKVQLDIEILVSCLNGGLIDVHKLQPIPITEEILLKCGFEKDEIVKCLYHLKIGNIIISITIEGSDVLDVTFANTNITGVSIDTEICLYLHGLQNITQSLTNTELNITL